MESRTRVYGKRVPVRFSLSSFFWFVITGVNIVEGKGNLTPEQNKAIIFGIFGSMFVAAVCVGICQCLKQAKNSESTSRPPTCRPGVRITSTVAPPPLPLTTTGTNFQECVVVHSQPQPQPPNGLRAHSQFVTGLHTTDTGIRATPTPSRPEPSSSNRDAASFTFVCPDDGNIDLSNMVFDLDDLFEANDSSASTTRPSAPFLRDLHPSPQQTSTPPKKMTIANATEDLPPTYEDAIAGRNRP